MCIKFLHFILSIHPLNPRPFSLSPSYKRIGPLPAPAHPRFPPNFHYFHNFHYPWPIEETIRQQTTIYERRQYGIAWSEKWLKSLVPLQLMNTLIKTDIEIATHVAMYGGTEKDALKLRRRSEPLTRKKSSMSYLSARSETAVATDVRPPLKGCMSLLQALFFLPFHHLFLVHFFLFFFYLYFLFSFFLLLLFSFSFLSFPFLFIHTHIYIYSLLHLDIV